MKKTKRSQYKYPALVREVNPKSRQECIDMDYLHKLSDEEMKFLNDFVKEYLHSDFSGEGQKFHATPEERRECYSRNNARNRDWFTLNRTCGWVVNLRENQDLIDNLQNPHPERYEEFRVEMIDQNLSGLLFR